MLHSHAVTRHADENGIIVNNESCMENAEMCVGARRTTWFYTSVWVIRGHVKHFVTRNKAPIDDYFPIRPSKDVYDDSIRGRHAWLRIIVSSLSLILTREALVMQRHAPRPNEQRKSPKRLRRGPFQMWEKIGATEILMNAFFKLIYPVTLALSRSTKNPVSAGVLNR